MYNASIKLEKELFFMSENVIFCYSGTGNCLQYCPKGAISVGNVTDKREHYHNPNVRAGELTEQIIHID